MESDDKRSMKNDNYWKYRQQLDDLQNSIKIGNNPKFQWRRDRDKENQVDIVTRINSLRNKLFEN